MEADLFNVNKDWIGSVSFDENFLLDKCNFHPDVAETGLCFSYLFFMWKETYPDKVDDCFIDWLVENFRMTEIEGRYTHMIPDPDHIVHINEKMG